MEAQSPQFDHEMNKEKSIFAARFETTPDCCYVVD